MKILLLAGCTLAAVALSACGTTSMTPATQDAFNQALVDKIRHCGGTIQINAGAGGLAGTGTGISNSAQLTCPAEPYTTTVLTSELPTQAVPTSPATAPAAGK